ncbi:MAG: hypothetical protein ACOZQL_39050 [Myxococcota bacterium]
MSRSFVVVALLLAGCGTNTEVESQLTITQGLYGQLTERCDQTGCVGAPKQGTPVGWFTVNPFNKTDAGTFPEAALEKTSGPNGFFEFALDAGSRGYLAIGEVRTSQGVVWFSATSTLIPKGLGRIDWHPGPGAEGTWTDVK